LAILKSIAKGLARSLPVSLYSPFIKRRVAGTYYHLASKRSLDHVKHLYPYKSPVAFEQDLLFLKDNYSMITYDELINQHPNIGDSVFSRVILTVDDGYSECFSTMRPLLLKHGVPCIFFVTTEFIGNRNMFYRNKASLCITKVCGSQPAILRDILDEINKIADQSFVEKSSLIEWINSLTHADVGILDSICRTLEIDVNEYLVKEKPYLSHEQIKQLIDDGFTIGSHTRTHPMLNQLGGETEIEEEIVESCRAIKELTGQSNIPFAFPFTGEGLNRSFLEDLISRYDFIGMMFGSEGLRQDKGFIINRIALDSPVETTNNEESQTNIPQLFREACLKLLVWNIGRRLRIISGSKN